MDIRVADEAEPVKQSAAINRAARAIFGRLILQLILQY